MGLVDPLAGAVHQELQVLFGAEGFGLEAGHLTGGRGLIVLGAATDHGPQCGIEAEAFGVVDILVPSQPAVDRLAEEGEQAVLRVLSGPAVVQAGRH